MLPRDLNSDSFKHYPAEARKLATNYVPTLQQLPLSFVPGMLRELIDYDFKFPAERKALENELTYLSKLSPTQTTEWFKGFTKIALSSKLEHFDWVNSPAQFTEQLSAHLWTTHQLDAYRSAALAYADRLHAAIPPEKSAIPRLGITVIGKGVDSYSEPIFRKLRPHGAYFASVNPQNGLALLLEAVTDRAKAHPAPFGHWYIDGGEAADHDSSLTCVSYEELAPVRAALLRKIHAEIERPGMGPEMLRTLLAEMRPTELGMNSGDVVLDRFQTKLLTEGSGTQIFSTSFTQWAAREALRRAQPLTLLVRFAPRQRQRPMNELLTTSAETAEFDPVGSLVDGDMGAYYNWINQQRLPGAEQSSFVAWFEGHGTAIVIGPSVPRGTESNSSGDMKQLLAWIA
jgi:hypothetical protein